MKQLLTNRPIVRRAIRIIIISTTLLVVLWQAQLKPSNDRIWSRDQVSLPEIAIDGHIVTIDGVRNFRYLSEAEFEPAFETRVYDLQKLRRLWLIQEQLSSFWEGLGHVMLSFEFDSNEFLAVSVEIRKEQGETFSPIAGLFRQYELMYVCP